MASAASSLSAGLSGDVHHGEGQPCASSQTTLPLSSTSSSINSASTVAAAPLYATRSSSEMTTGPYTSMSSTSSPAGTPFLGPVDSPRGRIGSVNGIPPELDESPDDTAVPWEPSSEPLGSSIKGPGLIRRISRGAASRLARRRTSASHNDKRDRSSGPVIMRRRSDSKAHPGNSRESIIVDSSVDDDENDPFDSLCGSEATSVTSESPSPLLYSREVAVAPKVDSALQRGTVLTKVTRKKRKQVRFFFDSDAAKVRWDPNNPAKRFYIDDIKEVRVGSDARNYREEHHVPAELESRWITIIFADPDRSKGRPVKTLHLITPDDYTQELWTTTLEHVSRYRIGLMAGLAGSNQSEAVLRAHWQREISRRYPQGVRPGEVESLDLATVESVCHSLHINCSKHMLRAQFAKADVGNKGVLTFAEFKDFIARLKDRKDIKRIYRGLASDAKEGLTLSEFLDFLRDVQKEDVENKRELWTSVFERFVRRARTRAQGTVPDASDTSSEPRMSCEAFSAYLHSETNGIYASRKPESRFDRPLNEYFISSSHNTYLLGRQVAGASSTEAYITALQQGCRCVEIDCWDGADGRPIVSHGRTMTTSVLFADCITVIQRYAFVTTDLPLILSLEVHCSPEQQLAMVKIMKETFGEQLVTEPLLTNCGILPSPEELKHRILVKVKTCDDPQPPLGFGTAASRFGGDGTMASFHGRKRSMSSPFIRSTGSETSTAGPSLSSPPTVGGPGVDAGSSTWGPGRRSATTTSLSSATEDSDSALATSAKRERKRRQRSKITKPLSDLGVYTRGYKWNSFSAPESRLFNHVFSFAERSYESITRDSEQRQLMEAHNKRFLTRVYPSGFRLRSSNFDPIAFWRGGVQMVALNWQTYDTGMQVNQAMFAAGTDRTGFVLKPESMRRPSSLLEARGGQATGGVGEDASAVLGGGHLGAAAAAAPVDGPGGQHQPLYRGGSVRRGRPRAVLCGRRRWRQRVLASRRVWAGAATPAPHAHRAEQRLQPHVQRAVPVHGRDQVPGVDLCSLDGLVLPGRARRGRQPRHAAGHVHGQAQQPVARVPVPAAVRHERRPVSFFNAVLQDHQRRACSRAGLRIRRPAGRAWQHLSAAGAFGPPAGAVVGAFPLER
ncbi:hypothetical protein VTN31DRAFT_598 [Thermomyces dupontii]|uniref:uncharacterized protein n=1 Tax=Talaromyces thermophilus TaxID=28565 RepID=UPI00374499C8